MRGLPLLCAELAQHDVHLLAQPQCLVEWPLPYVAAEDQTRGARIHGQTRLLDDVAFTFEIAPTKEHQRLAGGGDDHARGIRLADLHGAIGLGGVGILLGVEFGHIDLDDIRAQFTCHASGVVDGIQAVAPPLASMASPRG